MAITPQGGTTGTSLEVESGTRALRSIPHGNDWQCYGSYADAGPAGPFSTFGTIPGSLWQFRVPNMAPNHVCAVRRVVCSWRLDAVGAAGVWVVQLFIVRNATVNGTGGAQLSTLANNGKLRTSMGGQSIVGQGGDVRIQNVSNAALGAMTGTQDAMPIASFSLPQSGTQAPTPPPIITMFEARAGEHPIILGPNEGLNFNMLTVAGTSDFAVGVYILYDELVAY